MHKTTSGVIIPQTPRPCKINNLFENARERFIGVIWVTCDSAEKYVQQFDYSEPYSEEKSYSLRPYLASYDGCIREYQNYLCVCSTTSENEEYYVIAKSLPNELEILEPFCPCSTCQATFWNPLKYIKCPHCTSCIKSGPGFAKKEYIEMAKKRREQTLNNQENPTKLQVIVSHCNATKICEYMMIAIPIFMYAWFSYF